jgi:hypothetical protein
MIIDNVAAYSEEGLHNVAALPVGKRRVDADPKGRPLISAIPMPAGLRRQTPISHTLEIGNLIAVAVGIIPRSKRAFGPADCFQPGHRVDLVEIGM